MSVLRFRMGFDGVGKTVRKLVLLLGLFACSPCWAAFRSAGAATSVAVTTTSAACGAPAGFVAGDILIEVLSSDANSSTASPPSGFTQLVKDTWTTPDGQVMFIWWKRAVGSDSLTVTGMSNGASKLLRCFAWSGRDTTNPPVISTSALNQSSNASPTTLTANGVTALTGDDLFWFGALDVNAASATNTFTQPTGYTSQGSSVDTVDQFNVIAAATKDNVSAGATGTVSGTLTHSGSAGWDAFVIRIPAAGGGGGGSPTGFNKRQKLCKLDETLC